MKEMSSSWSDLPQDIIQTICFKLTDLGDQIRFRSVCKRMRICDSYCLPWVFIHKHNCSQVSILTDPNSKKVNNVSTFQKFTEGGFESMPVFYASKYGWLLQSLRFGSLVLHNPFSGDHIFLAELPFENCRAATFTVNPYSPDCEVLVLCSPLCGHFFAELYIARYSILKAKQWKTKYLGTYHNSACHLVHYMKGELYCLFDNGMLKSYNLRYESWKLVSADFPIPRFESDHETEWWMTENKENLIVVCKRSKYIKFELSHWMIYRFDFLQNYWVNEKSVESTSIFISGRVVITSPLVDKDGKRLEECYVCCYHNSGCYGFQAYSFKQMKSLSMEQYRDARSFGTFSFIEPPSVTRN